MAIKNKWSDIDLSVYDGGFKGNSATKSAEKQKTNAEKALANYGDFSYANQGAYDSVLDKILNREDFSYDLNGDALYQQYKDKYIQQGKMAMMDTMGQASALTGGYGSSYATTAGNQAYQSHLQNLNDIVPELYQMAYDRYNQEGQDLMNQYGVLSNDRSTAYGEWSDGYNRLASDRDYYSNNYFNVYGQESDTFYNNYNMDSAEYWNAYNAGYGAERDAIADAQWQKEFDEAKRQYEEQMAFQREQAKKKISSGGRPNDDGDDVDDDVDDDKPTETTPDYNSIYADCNAYIASGASRSNISTYIRNALKEGYISQGEYNKLKETFLPSGSSGSGGRYAY